MSESLRGEGDSLKETVLARELYGKGQDFDTAADPVVRIDARRLRDKLREYYSEFSSDPVLVTVPKGTYAPVFEWNPAASSRVVAAIPLAVDSRPVSQQVIHPRRRYLVAASICLWAWPASSAWLHASDPQGAGSLSVMPDRFAGLGRAAESSPDGQPWLSNGLDGKAGRSTYLRQGSARRRASVNAMARRARRSMVS